MCRGLSSSNVFTHTIEIEEAPLLGVRVLNRKLNSYSLIAAAIITFAVALRLALVILHWPSTNSDEGIMAIIANDIAYKGKFPQMFYGQDYMGIIEAYLGAIFYHLTGSPSITAIRLGVISLVGLFFFVMYKFISLIYSQKMALTILALMSVGSIPYLSRQTLATGGSAETLLFGALSFFLAAQLSLSYDRLATRRTKLLRLLGYTLFGIVVGVGLWSDMVGLPLYAMATLLLLTFCWREIFIMGGWFTGLLGGAIGLLPTIIYTLTHSADKNPLAILFGMVGGAPSTATPEQLSLWHKIVETLQVSLPTATSSPFCPVIEYPFMGDNTARTLTCGIIQSSWSIGYVLLIIASISITILALKRLKRNQEGLSEEAQHKTRVTYVTRLFMLGAAILALVTYINSSGPIDQPGYHARYLVSLVVITPVILAPLWYAAEQLRPTLTWAAFRFYGSRVVLGIIALILIGGTCIAFIEVPRARVANRDRENLVNELAALHISYLYTDYWTCYSLVVASMDTQHPITCAIIDTSLFGGNTHNRIKEYRVAVDQSYRPGLMCTKNPQMTTVNYNCLANLEAWAKQINASGRNYFVRHDLTNYVLYRPESRPKK